MAYLLERIILAILAWLMLIAGAAKEYSPIEQTHIQQSESVSQSIQRVERVIQSVETQPESVSSDYSGGFTHYRINGVTPPVEWQRILYDLLSERGIAWFYPYACAQIYQESNWNQWSDNGKDKGLCQQKAIYWAERAAAAGVPGADIWDVYAQLQVYTWMMGQYLAASEWSVEGALSMYYLGHAGYSAEYVGHVMRWMDYLEVVK